ncbi:MAG: hypothetical protein MZU97_17450 [Bacillus subtilis]|nr:hypothetical protein [Bacillus subtilis]
MFVDLTLLYFLIQRRFHAHRRPLRARPVRDRGGDGAGGDDHGRSSVQGQRTAHRNACFRSSPSTTRSRSFCSACWSPCPTCSAMSAPEPVILQILEPFYEIFDVAVGRRRDRIRAACSDASGSPDEATASVWSSRCCFC